MTILHQLPLTSTHIDWSHASRRIQYLDAVVLRTLAVGRASHLIGLFVRWNANFLRRCYCTQRPIGRSQGLPTIPRSRALSGSLLHKRDRRKTEEVYQSGPKPFLEARPKPCNLFRQFIPQHLTHRAQPHCCINLQARQPSWIVSTGRAIKAS